MTKLYAYQMKPSEYQVIAKEITEVLAKNNVTYDRVPQILESVQQLLDLQKNSRVIVSEN